MGSHTVTSQPTQVNTLHLYHSQTGQYSIYPPQHPRGTKGWVDLQNVTHPSSNRTGVEQLRWWRVGDQWVNNHTGLPHVPNSLTGDHILTSITSPSTGNGRRKQQVPVAVVDDSLAAVQRTIGLASGATNALRSLPYPFCPINGHQTHHTMTFSFWLIAQHPANSLEDDEHHQRLSLENYKALYRHAVSRWGALLLARPLICNHRLLIPAELLRSEV